MGHRPDVPVSSAEPRKRAITRRTAAGRWSSASRKTDDVAHVNAWCPGAGPERLPVLPAQPLWRCASRGMGDHPSREVIAMRRCPTLLGLATSLAAVIAVAIGPATASAGTPHTTRHGDQVYREIFSPGFR